MKEQYIAPQIEIIILESNEVINTLITSMDGTDIVASWLRGEA